MTVGLDCDLFYVETKLHRIRSLLTATPPMIEDALGLLEDVMARAKHDAEEIWRLRHEVVQYSELTQRLLLEYGKVKHLLQTMTIEFEEHQKKHHDVNRRCTEALIELKEARKLISKLEAALDD